MKKLTLILLCSIPLLGYANSNQHLSELTTKEKLLLGSWQCKSSPNFEKKYNATISATYQFLPNHILKVSKINKESNDAIYRIDTEKTWGLVQEGKLTLIVGQNISLTYFDSQNSDPETDERLKEFASGTYMYYLNINQLDAKTFNFGYIDAFWSEFDVFRCQRTQQ